jgi:hypothetical protein
VFQKIITRRHRGRYAQSWPINEASGMMPDGWVGGPDNRRFALMPVQSVESSNGLTRCCRLIQLEE